MDLLVHKLLKTRIFKSQKVDYHQKKATLIQHLFFVKFCWIGCKAHHLGTSYYGKFLGGLGNNGFQLK